MEARPKSNAESVSIKNKLAATRQELNAIQKELAMEREEAIQSYLNSKPLIDKLKKLKSKMAKSKSQYSNTAAALATLKSQLNNIKFNIESKQGDTIRVKSQAEETNKLIENLKEEIQLNQVEIHKQQSSARDEIKKDLRIKTQSLYAVQLMLRAAEMEMDSIITSMAGVDLDDTSNRHNSMMELTYEEYSRLKRQAKEKVSVAERPFMRLVEQRQAAERGREAAIMKLQTLNNEIERRKNREILNEIEKIESEQKMEDDRNQNITYKKCNKREGKPKTSECMRSRKCSRKEARFKQSSSIFHQIGSFLKRHCKIFFR